jgi:Heterokaryon incompatibility protein (HET)
MDRLGPSNKSASPAHPTQRDSLTNWTNPSNAGSELRVNNENHQIEYTAPAIHDFDQESFNYTPLMEKDMRLLVLQQASDDPTRIQANLIHKPLSAAQTLNYVALSYTWGLLEASVPITIDGKLFKVRPNVYRILQDLRRLKYVHVWVRVLMEIMTRFH